MTLITRLEPGDRTRWAELWEQYLDFYKTRLPPEQYDHTWARLQDGRLGGFAAHDGGRMIGLAHYLFHETGWSMQQTCYLQDLFVDHEARGRGAARALIAAVAEVATERHAQRLYWLTHETNEQARLLYDRVARNSGFIVYFHPV